jgi:hypothetical protein
MISNPAMMAAMRSSMSELPAAEQVGGAEAEGRQRGEDEDHVDHGVPSSER